MNESTPEQRNGVEAPGDSHAAAIVAPDEFRELTGGSSIPDLVKANVERTEADEAERQSKIQEAENSSEPVKKPEAKSEGDETPDDDDDWGLPPEAEAKGKDEPEGEGDQKTLFAGKFETPDELEDAYKKMADAVGIQGEYLDEMFDEGDNGRLTLKPELQAVLDSQETADENVTTVPKDTEELAALREKLDDQFGEGSSDSILAMIESVRGTEKKVEAKKDAVKAQEDGLNHALSVKVDEFKAARSEKTFSKYQERISAFYDRMPPELARELIVKDYLPMDDVLLMIKGKAELPALLKSVRDATRQESLEREPTARIEPSQSGITDGVNKPTDYASQVAGSGNKSDFDEWLHG